MNIIIPDISLMFLIMDMEIKSFFIKMALTERRWYMFIKTRLKSLGQRPMDMK